MLDAKDQGQKRQCSPKKKGLQKMFQAISKKRSLKKIVEAFSSKQVKNVFQNFFGDLQNFNNLKKKCCPLAEDRAVFEDLRPQGQGLRNVSLRTPPLVAIA